MDILKNQITVAVGECLKDLTREKMNLSKDLADTIEVHQIGTAMFQVRVTTHKGPRYFHVRVVEKL